jgi:hypothetical protein
VFGGVWVVAGTGGVVDTKAGAVVGWRRRGRFVGHPRKSGVRHPLNGGVEIREIGQLGVCDGVIHVVEGMESRGQWADERWVLKGVVAVILVKKAIESV